MFFVLYLHTVAWLIFLSVLGDHSSIKQVEAFENGQPCHCHNVLPEILWQVRCSVYIPAAMILIDNVRNRTYLLSFGFSRFSLP